MALFLIFDLLENQRLFIYNDPDFHKESTLKILQYIYKCNLEISVSEVVKLLKLNSEIAITSASVKRSFSFLKGVKTYLRNEIGPDRLFCVEYHCKRIS